MIKIVKSTKDNVTTYQVVDAAWEDIPENRGKPASTVLEAVNLWLSPNNDESEIAKFLAEVPIVEEEQPSEPIVGVIPYGNIINMVMGKDTMRPATYHSLVDWCMNVLGYTTDDSYDELDEKFISELNQRVQKIEDPLLLLKMVEVSKEGIRGCWGDKHSDAVAKLVQVACMDRLGAFADRLPPTLWHQVHRHELWMGNAQTEIVGLPSPNGWVAISGFREAQHGAWKVKLQIGENEYLSPQYVEKMGLKARHDDYAKGSHSGVQCQAYHLFNADGSLWGYEVYLISPKKTVGCEVTKDGRFSLFRSGVHLPPRNDIRQGDMLLRRIEVQAQDEIIATRLDYTPREVQSVTVVHSEAGSPHSFVKLTVGTREHRHRGFFWHPISRMHVTETVTSTDIAPDIPEERVDRNTPSVYEKVLHLTCDAILTHPDHPSISLTVGYYQILPVEGETDYQPRQRGD